MKKIKKLLLPLVALACFNTIACGNTSTTQPTTLPEIEVPEIQYTIEEEIAAGVTANDEKYAVSNVEQRENSPLKGKTIYWLGSSVTYGSASQSESMADYLQALTGCICKKDAVSGTTIFDDNKTTDTGLNSYTRRLTNSKVFDKTEKVDAFVCQISTNDARNDRLTKRGFLTHEDKIEVDDFDLATTIGGIEYIIAYVTSTWGCPVYFYSGSYFGDTGDRKSTNPTGTNYAKLIEDVYAIADKWNSYEDYHVGVIDLYNDEDFNAQASNTYYKWATSDAIHPRRAGYLQWWTPYFEHYLLEESVLNKAF